MSLWNKITQRKANRDVANNLIEKTQQEVDRIEPINILVAGKTGSG